MAADALCGGVGTFDALAHTCSCPLTHAGKSCQLFRQPACSLDSVHALRPLFWVKTILMERHRPAALSTFGLGPLPCRCVRELLQATAQFRNSLWTVTPSRLLCAADQIGTDVTVGALLDSGGSAARWVNMSVDFGAVSKVYRFKGYEIRAGASSSSSHASAAQLFDGWRLMPLADCVESCGRYGWCLAEDPSATAARSQPPAASVFGRRPSSRCRCFPEAVRTARGSCAPVTHAKPFREAEDEDEASARGSPPSDPSGPGIRGRVP